MQSTSPVATYTISITNTNPTCTPLPTQCIYTGV